MKPPNVFDRDLEWAALERFVGLEDRGPLLALVTGRRRTGKTWLLRAFIQQSGGAWHVFPANMTADRMLEGLGASMAAARNIGAPIRYLDWSTAFRDILAFGGPVVLDEFSYALGQDPSLGSQLQNAFDEMRQSQVRNANDRASPTRLILCGSAIGIMEGLVDGGGPLNGRLTTRLVLHPFDPWTNAAFWGLDARRALLVQVVLGGIPAYRTLFKVAPPEHGEAPELWLLREILAQDRAIFFEPRILLDFEGRRQHAALHATLQAVGLGANRLSEIAARTGSSAQAAEQRLRTLAEVRLVENVPDVFRQNRATWRLVDPLLRTWFAVMEPSAADLERLVRPDPGLVAQRFRAQVLGPGLEDLCRAWMRRQPGVESVGSGVTAAGEVDVVAFGRAEGGRRAILAVGEAKARECLFGAEEVARLARIRDSLPDRFDRGPTRLACFSTTGFQPGIGGDDVELVSLERIYRRT